MPIKVIDTLIPATNNFKVVNASNVAYKDDVKSAEEIIDGLKAQIDTLDTLINSAPKLSYYNISDASQIQSFSTNEEVFITFNIESRKPGQCVVSVERKNGANIEDTSGVYSVVARQNIFPGNNIKISLGKAANFSVSTYRVSVTDSTGAQGKLEGTDSIFMHFFIKTGEIRLYSNFQLGKNTYSESIDDDGNVVPIKVIIPYQLDVGSVLGEKNIECNVTYIDIFDNNKLYEEEISFHNLDETIGNLPLEFYAFTNAAGEKLYGNYVIKMQGNIGGDSLYSSNEVDITIPVLESNSSSLVLNSNLKDQISTEDILSVSITPTTSSTGAQGTNQLSATFTLNCIRLRYWEFEGSQQINECEITDYKIFEVTSTVTHGVEFSQFLGKIKPVIDEALIAASGNKLSPTDIISDIDCEFIIQVAPKNLTSFPGHKIGEFKKDLNVFLYSGDKAIDLESNNICFNLDDMNKISSNKWDSLNSDPSLSLDNMNALSGIKYESTKYGDDINYFRFSSGSVGSSTFTSENIRNQYSNSLNGFTVETYIRCTTLGELNEVGFSLDTTNASIKISPNSAFIRFAGTEIDAAISSGEFSHIAFVYDPKITENSNVNPYPTLRIFVNGILTKIEYIPSDAETQSLGYINNLTLGAYFDTATKSFINKCNTDINLLRIYNKKLSSTEILTNYKSHMLPNHKNVIKEREDAGVMEIHFIKNKGVGNILNKEDTWNRTFEDMNKIEVKKGTAINPGSKNAYVNCTMYCKYLDKSDALLKWKRYEDVDVWLQGTSSLKYPVKNYQIKLWEGRTSSTDEDGNVVYADGNKLKIIPPGKDIEDGWHPDAKDYVFTLKCDYMEQSHRNNTPTACYYEDKVLNNVIDFVNKTQPATKPESQKEKLYSPAKRFKDSEGNRIYRDAINGFPCKVYYYDNNDDKKDLNESWQSDSQQFAPSELETLAGTYMFNVDKEGKQLGFDISVKKAIENSNIIDQVKTATELTKGLIEDYNCTQKDGVYYYYTYAYSYGKIAPITFEDVGEDERNYYFNIKYGENEDGTPLFVKTDSLPCISYEGATNNNSSAAAFYPLDKIDIYEAYKAYVNNLFESYKNMFINFQTTIDIGAHNVYMYNIYCYENIDKHDNTYTLMSGNGEDVNKESFYVVEKDGTSITPEKIYINGDGVLYNDVNFESPYTSGDSIKVKLQLINSATTGSYMGVVADLANKYGAGYEDFLKYVEVEGAREYIFSAATSLDTTGNNIVYQDYLIGKIKSREEYTQIQDDNTIYEYIASTLEPRHTYTEDFEKKDYYNILTYDTIKKAIDWVYNASEPILNPTDSSVWAPGFNKDTFKNEFESYFSFEYCLTYYLQMMLFAQVDNAGKNAMFDTWGDGKLYPRPYDMDTQMGLDNSGHDQIPVSCELHWELSPSECESDSSSPASVGNWIVSTSENHGRYKRYNTYESRLWKTFAKVFSTEISECYKYLRSTMDKVSGQGVYNIDSICNYINAKTSEAISESLYNSDVESKYLAYKTGGEYNPEYLYVTQGNRVDRYKEFLTQRLAFLDTVFKYYESTTNGSMLLRCNSLTNVSKIGIEVDSPQYIQFVVDAGNQATVTAFVSPEDTFTVGDITYNGVQFNIPTTGADKNIIIYGVGNVRNIHFLKELYPTHVELGQARVLTSVDLTNASKLTNIFFGNNIYLKKVNLQGLKELSKTIDLSNCTSIENINIAGSGITNIRLPESAPIEVLNISNTPITELTLNNMVKLSITENSSTGGLKYQGCTNIETLNFNNCILLDSFDFTQSKKLNSVSMKSCHNISNIEISGITNLNKFEVEDCDGIAKIILDNCAGNAFKKLNFTGVKNLKYLSLCSTQLNSEGTGVMQLAPSLEYGDDGETVIRETKWEKINLYETCISGLSTKGEILEDDTPDDVKNTYNFENIIFDTIDPKPVQFYKDSSNTNKVVKYIENLDYKGNASSLFTLMKNLKQVNNLNLTPTGTSIGSIFSQCSNLEQVTFEENGNNEWRNITNSSSAFYSCPRIKFDSLKDFLNKIPKVTNLSSFVSLGYRNQNDGNYEPTIPYNFFSNNKEIQNLSSAFYGSDIEAIEPGLLDIGMGYEEEDNPYITNVASMFANASKLKYVPHNLFVKLPNLENLKSTFLNCGNLGATQEHNGTPCIMTTSFKYIFHEDNKVWNLMGTFAGCKKLGGFTQDEQNSVKDLLDQLPNLILANGAFALCGKEGKGIKHLPENVFEGVTENNLINIDGMFMGAGLDCQLPESLALTSNRLKNLKCARGTFCDNPKLFGNVSSSFFASCKNIKSIGSTAIGKYEIKLTKDDITTTYKDYSFASSSYLSTPGIFANTGIESIDYNVFNGLTNLEDCSFMFYTGTSGNLQSSTSGISYRFNINENNYKEFKVRIPKETGDIYLSYIPAQLFTDNGNIKNLNGMFAFKTGLKGIAYFDDEDTDKTIESNRLNYEEENYLFDSMKNVLISAAGMFIGCKDLKYVNLKALFNDCTKLTNISAMFADTLLNYNFNNIQEV